MTDESTMYIDEAESSTFHVSSTQDPLILSFVLVVGIRVDSIEEHQVQIYIPRSQQDQSGAHISWGWFLHRHSMS